MIIRVHPRVGGETQSWQPHRMTMVGSSPRGRGNLPRRTHCTPRRRFIPAWAGKPAELIRLSSVERVHPRVGGETRRRVALALPHRVHPRVGGETRLLMTLATAFLGSSPRGRGNLDATIASGRRHGFIPAWAGKPSLNRVTRISQGVHPRVGGETATSRLLA